MAVDSPRSCNSRLRAPRLLPLVVALLCAQQAMAQDATAPASEGATNLDKVVVTGSNIRTTTAAEEGPAPVAVITQEDLQLLGYTDVKDVLRFDAAFTVPFASPASLVRRRNVGTAFRGVPAVFVLLEFRSAAEGVPYRTKL